MAPGGPDGPIGPMGGDMVPPVMNGMSNPGDGMDGMKSSPANGPGTPREDSGPPISYDITAYGQENVSFLHQKNQFNINIPFSYHIIYEYRIKMNLRLY